MVKLSKKIVVRVKVKSSLMLKKVWMNVVKQCCLFSVLIEGECGAVHM